MSTSGMHRRPFEGRHLVNLWWQVGVWDIAVGVWNIFNYTIISFYKNLGIELIFFIYNIFLYFILYTFCGAGGRLGYCCGRLEYI